MPSVWKEDGKWIVRWKNAAGRRKTERTQCATKAEAKEMLDCQQLMIPAGVQSQLVVGNDIGPTLRGIEMRQTYVPVRSDARIPH